LPQRERRQDRREQFEGFALEHFDILYKVARALTRQADEAEELVQETYCRAYRFFDQFEPGTNGRAWLLTILRHTYINGLRQHKRRGAHIDFEQVAPFCAASKRSSAWDSSVPLHEFLWREVQDEVKQAIEALLPEYRLVLALAVLAECSNKEIAAIIGCPVGTVMSRLFRARKQLRAQLRPFALQTGYVRV
jgi:RNA polymerase sigma-70 factor, ECF subfamily